VAEDADSEPLQLVSFVREANGVGLAPKAALCSPWISTALWSPAEAQGQPITGSGFSLSARPQINGRLRGDGTI